MIDNIEVNSERVFPYNDREYRGGTVVYWMSRDQRSKDNWALIYAIKKARELNTGLAVVFCLVDEFLNAAIRQFGFMLKGFQEIEEDLKNKNIPYIVLNGTPEKILPEFISKNKVGMLITDFDPLKIKIAWRKSIDNSINIPFHEVDAHNIVPCRFASDKKEFSARTIRPKIVSKLMDFLAEYPDISEIKFGKENLKLFRNNNRNISLDEYQVSPSEVSWLVPGEKAANETLQYFLENKINDYADKRNQPAYDVLSNLSPYLHFGQISAQRIALETKKAHADQKSKDSFLEEIIVRRELSDNFCFYEKNYDNFDGFHDWAKKTLSEHKADHREHLYSLETLENAETHDELWNTAQKEMLATGKMHGYMRMYWAKKILEWTLSPENAMEYAIYLNDKYELDGRDPNGYTGIAWSIGGIHDRSWQERNIFGKVRYMSYNSQIKKVKLQDYIDRIKIVK
jgi:deoxyribodipyrimidine photo-lyase